MDRIVGIETEYGCLMSSEELRCNSEVWPAKVKNYLFNKARAGTIDLLLEPTTQAPSGVRAGPSSRSLHGLLPAPDQPVTWNSADWWRKP